MENSIANNERQRRPNGNAEPRQRRPKIKYEFHKRRAGDVLKVRTAQARVYYMSAFANWKRNRPGTLSVKSVRVDDGYLLLFSGISPAEANEARLNSGEDI